MTQNPAFKPITVEANGHTIHALDAGEGPLVIALHGFPDLPISYRHQIPFLVERGYRVIAPYLHGYYPAVQEVVGPFEVASLVQDVLALIDRFTQQPAIVIGHDWGATVARSAAIVAPDKIARIVCMSVPTTANFSRALVTNPEQQRRSWYVYFFQLPFAEMAMAHNDFEFIERLWREWSPGMVVPPTVMNEIKAAFRHPSVLNAALGYYRALFNPALQQPDYADMRKRFNEPIPVPTIYLHGADDGCIGPETTDGMDAAFPKGLESHIIPGAGHFVHQEQAEAVNEFIGRFLSKQL